METNEKLKLELQKLDAKKQEAIDKATIEYNATKATGFLCSAVTPNFIVFRGLKTKAEVMHVLKVYEPSKASNAFLRFACKEPIETESPFLLCIGNYTHVKNDRFLTADLKYKTDSGLEVWIELGKEIIDFNKHEKKVDEGSTARNPETYAFFTLENKTGLKCQTYYGGHLAYHGPSDRFLALFK